MKSLKLVALILTLTVCALTLIAPSALMGLCCLVMGTATSWVITIDE